jgi:hypothetical protein
MPELRPGSRVGVDAVGIVVDVRGNKTRTDNSEKQQDLGLRAFQDSHAHLRPRKTVNDETIKQNKWRRDI